MYSHKTVGANQAKEISIAALMTVRDMLGWGNKTVLFSGRTLAEFLNTFSTQEGDNLYDVVVDQNGAVRIEYMVWLNNRPVKRAHSLDIVLEAGDRVVVTPVMKFSAGG